VNAVIFGLEHFGFLRGKCNDEDIAVLLEASIHPVRNKQLRINVFDAQSNAFVELRFFALDAQNAAKSTQKSKTEWKRPLSTERDGLFQSDGL